MTQLRSFACAVALVSAVSVHAQDEPMVKITVPRANVRSEASDRAPVVTQVPVGTLLTLLSIEGEWFKVRVPIGSIRIEAYVSKKVAAAAPTPSASPAATAATPAAPSPAPVSTGVVDGMSVALNVNGTSTWLTPHPAKAGRDGQLWTWVVEKSAADRIVDDRRPAFVVMFKDVPGVSPDDLAPMIVRVTPVAAGGRLVASARGGEDLATRTIADWDLSKELKQEIIRAETQMLERGAVRLRPAGDLPAGEYAIVLRPSSKKKLAAASVLSSSGEGRAFALAWDFAIR